MCVCVHKHTFSVTNLIVINQYYTCENCVATFSIQGSVCLPRILLLFPFCCFIITFTKSKEKKRFPKLKMRLTFALTQEDGTLHFGSRTDYRNTWSGEFQLKVSFTLGFLKTPWWVWVSYMAVLLWNLKKINTTKLRLDTSKTAIILFTLFQLLLSLRNVKVLSRKILNIGRIPTSPLWRMGLTVAKGNANKKELV